MIGLAIIVGMGGMVFSLTGTFLEILRKSLGSDYLLDAALGRVVGEQRGRQPGPGRPAARAIPGVGAVSTMRFANATANGKAVSLLGSRSAGLSAGIQPDLPGGRQRHGFAALGSEPSLIANGVFAAQTGLKMGDVVQLVTPTGVKPYRIVAIAGDYLNAKIMTAYISQANLSQGFPQERGHLHPAQPGAQRRCDPGRGKMKDILKDYPAVQAGVGQELFRGE